MYRLWRWFLARFRLSLRAVCEESATLGPRDDFHDYGDSKDGLPYHFVELQCSRCGKRFYI